jgi:hypothetical protein
MVAAIEEKRMLEKELKKIRILYIGGLVFSGLISFTIAFLLQQLQTIASPFIKIEFFTGSWFWSLVIVVFCISFISWVSIFGLITRERKIRRKLLEAERL